MFCEWTGNRVKLYDDNRTLRRQYSVRYPVRSVQVAGEGNDARVAISMENGHTCLYQGDGRLIRA